MAHILIDVELTSFLYNPDVNTDITLEDFVVKWMNGYIPHYLHHEKIKEPINTLVLGMWCEEYPLKALNIIRESIDIIKKHFSFNIVLLLGQQYTRTRHLFPEYKVIDFDNADVHYIRAFPFRFYIKIFEHKISEPRDTYKKLPENKFLLLTGKPNRVHRVRLLYKLYKKDLLKHALWRFRVHNDYVRDRCRELLHDITDEEFDTFLNECQRDLDDVEIKYNVDSSHYSGIPFERWMWDSTMFQVVPEVDFNDNFPSEKTWLSIINKSPFIMLAQIHHNKELRDLGFRTFEKYLLHKEYNDVSIGCDNARLDQIIENIEYWINNIDKFYEEINEDVEHNFRVFMNIVNEDMEIINKIIEKYQLNCRPEDLVKGYYE